jgi:hypothetical protein
VGVDGYLYFPVPFINRVDQNERETLSILSFWAFSMVRTTSAYYAHIKDLLCLFSDPFNSFAYSQALFGEGIGPIWLRNFHCNGDEEKLEDCKSSDWGQTHCSHLQDASVSCGIYAIHIMYLI